MMQFQSSAPRLHVQLSASQSSQQHQNVNATSFRNLSATSIPTIMASHSVSPSSSATSVNIFIPTHLFSVIGQGTRAGLLFGYQQQQQQQQQRRPNGSKNLGKSLSSSTTTVHYNITALLPHDEAHLQQLIAQRRAVLEQEEKRRGIGNSSDSEDSEHYQFQSSGSGTAASSHAPNQRNRILFLGELVDASAEGNTASAPVSTEARSYREQLETLKRLWLHFQLVLSFDSAQWPKAVPLSAASKANSEAVILDSDHLLPYSAIRLSSLQLRDPSFKVSLSSLDHGDRGTSIMNREYSQVTLLYYDTRNFMSSQLLNRFTSEDQRVDFLEFINESLKNTAQLVTATTSSSLSSSKRSTLSSMTAEDSQTQTSHSENTFFADQKNKSAKTISKTIKHSSNSKTSKHCSCTCSPWNDPTFSTLMPLLLMPRSLIRAFLYFSFTSNHHHQQCGDSSTAKQPNSDHRHHCNWTYQNQKIHDEDHQDHHHHRGLYPLALQQWLLRPLAAFTERTPLLARSATVTQLKFRILQLAICWRLLRREIPAGRRSISLSLGNALSSVLVDVLLGVATIVALHYYSTPQYWLTRAWQYADSMVDDVDRLLRVLQSMPAGLKLNRPLNLALSQFYLYHIYLWESYMDIIRPVFGLVMQAIFYLGIFGFTCILSLLSDIFSLVTIHIYCFYGYGCQLYGLQVSGIGALWRLFRGKKYNQLRNRVDSYSYDNEQLFIGTILFTVLLFLLPTVFMYYLVFLVLRFLTLAVQEGLYFFIEHISSMPLYTLILWLLNSRTISGQVYLKVIDTSSSSSPSFSSSHSSSNVDQINPENNHHNRQRQRRQSSRAQRTMSSSPRMNSSNSTTMNTSAPSPMIVRLQTKRISLLSIITSRYDDMLQSLQAYRLSSSAKQLTWNEFFQSILSGRLLHQNLSIGLSLLLFIGYLLLIVYFALNSVST